ncbi:MAG: MltA domain-containing protein [Elusimicrobia bacterium]|nr:MltA domain-containing protein [Elusimicrobiota bacterium]
MRNLIFSLLLFFTAAPRAAGQEWYRAGNDTAETAPAPPAPAGTLDGCPKFTNLSDVQGYPDLDTHLKEVTEVSSSTLPLPADDLDRAGLLEALNTDLDYWNSKPGDFKIQIGKDSYSAVQMRLTIKKLADIFSSGVSGEELRKAIKDQFRIYRAAADDGSNKIIITGYYEAEIAVSRTRSDKEKYAVYLKPADLIKTTPDMGVDFDYGRLDENGKVVKHYSRQEIHEGRLDGKNLEIVWSAHPSQIMLAQIQGSAVLRFSDGDFLRAGFDGANGWPYRSVQKILIDCGETPSMSFKAFINYLSSQPVDREERLVDLDPRFIFFRVKPKDSLPYGAIGRALTAGRSVAIDPQYIPLGLFGLLSSKKPVAAPDGGVSSFKDFTRFIATHDTGSAIRGPGRLDLFWGTGGTAETEASSMKAPGELYLFILR